VPEDRIFITGNTVVDALQMTIQSHISLNLGFQTDGFYNILVTAHRRESFGAPFESICLALRDLADKHQDIQIIYPVHFNPNVRDPVFRILSNHSRIHLIEPLRYEQFAYLMTKAYLILTDSGGIQEEAPVLGKPTLVMRETTERPEAIEAGTAKLVGTDRARIVSEVEFLLNNKAAYHAMAQSGSPFGDGQASKRIVKVLLSELGSMRDANQTKYCSR
jgi:UDP-N-acetylglucosamine 2-epimerase (non-hydrolysing)